ncbi:hypothetical protein HK097_001111 [Rhizophlyctis rosea]|uniref:Uncharacterized protein n=1 Tax=Rhizophlyctis rosea TaxID=64517 RepID=A0AAD5S4R4_9FUNG|nr:hypothetical protein HK097_001111 [Rhizophlyctis rosea]
MENFIPPPAGGSVTGLGHMPSGLVEVAWIAVFVFFIWWLIHLLFSPIWNRFLSHKAAAVGEGGAAAVEDGGAGGGEAAAEGAENGEAGLPEETWRDRFRNKLNGMARAARDSLLILFGLTAVSIAGFGIPVATLALIWVVAFILFCWILAQILPTRIGWILDFLLTVPFVVLSIIIFARAFKDAPPYSSS